MKKITCSFVIVAYNHSQELISFLIANIRNVLLYCPLFDVEIIIVNTGDVKYIDNAPYSDVSVKIFDCDNFGYCGGNNYGIKNSSGDVIIICNPDIEFTNSLAFDWLISYSRFKNAIVGSYRDGKRWLTYPAMFPVDKKYDNDPLPFYYDSNPNESNPSLLWKSFPFVDGCLMAFPRNIFQATGGFDTNIFPGYFGENAFQFKAYLCGFKTLNVPINEFYIHHSESDSSYSIEQKMVWTQTSREYFYKTYALPHYDTFLKYLV